MAKSRKLKRRIRKLERLAEMLALDAATTHDRLGELEHRYEVLDNFLDAALGPSDAEES